MKLKFLPLPGHVMKLKMKDVLVAGAAGWHPSSSSVGGGKAWVEGGGEWGGGRGGLFRHPPRLELAGIFCDVCNEGLAQNGGSGTGGC